MERASRGLMNTIATLVQRPSSATPLALAPLNATSLRDQAYALLKNAIADTDIYDPSQELRLDERQLTTAPGADSRSVVAARAGRLHPHDTAARDLHHPQVQARNDRNDPDVGGARVHGRAAGDAAGLRCGNRQAAPSIR